MTDVNNAAAGSIEALVAALPEKYQPIFGHPELSDGSSRGCEDRLQLILDTAQRLQDALGRPLRVLDLGCAQGFFSLSLAAAGHSVRGADFLDRNVDVCRALAEEAGLTRATFECGRIEDVITTLQPAAYDLVLGLSVFHHLVHEHGLGPVVEIISTIASRIDCGIYEVAVREEPLYWGPSQPERASELLAPYAFQRVMSWQPTHLSGVARPLYFVSDRFWFVGNDFRRFDEWRFQSHPRDMSSHQKSRRYFFANGVMLKQYSLANAERREFNREEFQNEAGFLASAPEEFAAPALIEAVVDREDCWLVREVLPGRILMEMMGEHVPYAPERVVDGLIRQLVALESRNLFHNDVRCWNLVVDQDSEPHLIDFGAISPGRADCVWPDDLLLSLLITVREIFMAHVGPVLPVRRGLLDVGMLPMRYQAAFAHALSRPQGDWSFKELASRITAWNGEPVDRTGYDAALAMVERGMLSLEGALAAEQHQGRLVRADLDSSREDAHRWHLLAAGRDEEISALSHRQMSTSASYAAIQKKMEGLLEKLTVQEADTRRFRADHALVMQSLQEWQARSSELEVHANQQRARVGELEVHADHLQSRAGELDSLLRQVLQSRSWRLTAPLRGTRRMLQQPLIFARRVVLALMRRVKRHPDLARRLNSVARMVPPVHAKLVSVAVNNNIIAEVPARIEQEGIVGGVGNFSGLAESQGIERLSLRGRALYSGILTGNAEEHG
jgi:SAM-dependent methyltransferase